MTTKWTDLLSTTPISNRQQWRQQLANQIPSLQYDLKRYADPNRHRLIIKNLNEDYGQADYREELTWRIEHDLACEKKVMSMLQCDQQRFVREGMLVEEPMSEFDQQLVLYTCPLAQYVAEKGRNAVLPDIPWQNLEEGRYELALAYTTSYEDQQRRAWEDYKPYRAEVTLVLL